MHLYMRSTNDSIHTDSFPQGVTSYDRVFPHADVARGAFGLKVTFSDGVSLTRFCPNRDQTYRR